MWHGWFGFQKEGPTYVKIRWLAILVRTCQWKLCSFLMSMYHIDFYFYFFSFLYLNKLKFRVVLNFAIQSITILF